jgi:hypothetical protein
MSPATGTLTDGCGYPALATAKTFLCRSRHGLRAFGLGTLVKLSSKQAPLWVFDSEFLLSPTLPKIEPSHLMISGLEHYFISRGRFTR